MCYFALCLIWSRLMLTPLLLKLYQKCRAAHSLAPDGSCCLGPDATLFQPESHFRKGLKQSSDSFIYKWWRHQQASKDNVYLTARRTLWRWNQVDSHWQSVAVTSPNHTWQVSQQDAALRRANGRQLNPAELSFNARRSSLCALRATNRWLPEPLLQYKRC